MSELVFLQNKPPKTNLKELLLDKGLIWFVLFYVVFFLNEEFVNRWGITAVLIGALVICGLLVLISFVVVQWTNSERVQNRRVSTLHLEADWVEFRGHRRSQLVKFDQIKRVMVNRNLAGEIKSIALYKGVFHMLNCQNFADMPGLYAALKERLPASIQWSEPRPVRWLVKPYQGIILVIVSGWLFIWLLNIDFISAFNLSLFLLLGIQLTSQILQQSQHASRGAKVALILGATWILVAWLYAMGDIPQAINHPCGLVHRWQSGCLKAYPDSENLLFLPDGQLARLSGRAIVIEPVEGNSFINLFTATRLINDRYVSSLSFSADGRTAVAENRGDSILFWDVPAQSVTVQTVSDASNMVLSPDGKLVGPSGSTRTVEVLGTDTWQPVFSLKTENYTKTALGQTLLAVGLDQAVRFYDVRSGEETAVFPIEGIEGEAFVQRIVFSDDEQLLAVMNSQSIL